MEKRDGSVDEKVNLKRKNRDPEGKEIKISWGRRYNPIFNLVVRKMGRRRSGRFSPPVLPRSWSSLSVVFWSVVLLAFIMSDKPEQHQVAGSSTPEVKPAVHIVYMERPPEGEAAEPEAYHLKTLASVLGRYSFFSLFDGPIFSFLICSWISVSCFSFSDRCFFFSLCFCSMNERSQEAAMAALIYSYSAAASGFSAKLTPEQVEKLTSTLLSFSLSYFILYEKIDVNLLVFWPEFFCGLL